MIDINLITLRNWPTLYKYKEVYWLCSTQGADVYWLCSTQGADVYWLCSTQGAENSSISQHQPTTQVPGDSCGHPPPRRRVTHAVFSCRVPYTSYIPIQTHGSLSVNADLQTARRHSIRYVQYNYTIRICFSTALQNYALKDSMELCSWRVLHPPCNAAEEYCTLHAMQLKSTAPLGIGDRVKTWKIEYG